MEKRYLYVFYNGEMHKKIVKLLPDRYVVEIDENDNQIDEPIPLEDYGDYLLTENNLTEEEAFKEWLLAM